MSSYERAHVVERLGKRYQLESPPVLDPRTAPCAKTWLGCSGVSGDEQSHETCGRCATVSFEVSPGERADLIGRNGGGKSTMLKLLSRITAPTAGRAEIRGRVGLLLEVGTGFHPELTGRDNISLAWAILGMRHREIESKLDDIVEFAGGTVPRHAGATPIMDTLTASHADPGNHSSSIVAGGIGVLCIPGRRTI